ncbi:cytochrome c [Bradyrhizobium elkanii]|uniref:c-type cytochrome n=1 Tax=Bradyrhizobium TaxID=374 RepID=UPI0021676811|nr:MULTISPECIES: cytochrome c family protein [Bradyrhizobium]MCS3928982.1 cytochrome c [Bradyrhizobium elkanii]MCS3969538.1 cytochrome c [Bradyrhizobium japonicum]
MRRTVIAGVLLAGSATTALAADPAARQKILKAQRAICHMVVARENRIGLALYGVVGRPAGSVPSYNYTAGHKKLGVRWDAATLDKYLTDPRAMVSTTRWSTVV